MKYHKKWHRYLSYFLMAPTAIAHMAIVPYPYGSFNPEDFGFWYSIFFALVVGLLGDYQLYRFLGFIKRKFGKRTDASKDGS